MMVADYDFAVQTKRGIIGHNSLLILSKGKHVDLIQVTYQC